MNTPVYPRHHRWLVIVGLLAVLLFGSAALALAGKDAGPRSDFVPPGLRGDSPVGMWHLVIQYPDLPPFLEILVFHEGGTLSESNFLLHGNSANPFYPFNGSEGHGIWRYNRDGSVSFAFQKMTFDAENGNQPVGFLRVKGSAIVDGGVWQDLESNTSLVTPDGFVIIDFGQPVVTGSRLSLDNIP